MFHPFLTFYTNYLSTIKDIYGLFFVKEKKKIRTLLF